MCCVPRPFSLTHVRSSLGFESGQILVQVASSVFIFINVILGFTLKQLYMSNVRTFARLDAVRLIIHGVHLLLLHTVYESDNMVHEEKKIYRFYSNRD